MSSGGFAIISADTRMSPILGYSLEGNISDYEFPEGFKIWLSGIKKEYSLLQEADTHDKSFIDKSISTKSIPVNHETPELKHNITGSLLNTK